MSDHQRQEEHRRWEERPLEPYELRELRSIVEEHRRMRWLWLLLGRLSAWVMGFGAAIYAGKDVIAKFWRALTS